MTDYQKMHEIMIRASEKAIRILIEAQQLCEERYLSAEDHNKDTASHLQK